jgi:hypothetical protein
MMKSLTILALLGATSAQADLTLRFTEGAPKDRFTLTNTGDCALPAGSITVDLGTAPAGLIFDVTNAGAGVQVFQPFEVVAGADRLTSQPKVADGDTAVTLPISGLAAGQSVAFTIDVDDTGGGREITVSGSEIAGATLRATFGGATQSATVNNRAAASIAMPACLS